MIHQNHTGRVAPGTPKIGKVTCSSNTRQNTVDGNSITVFIVSEVQKCRKELYSHRVNHF